MSQANKNVAAAAKKAGTHKTSEARREAVKKYEDKQKAKSFKRTSQGEQMLG
jgi:hypothetical protein